MNTALGSAKPIPLRDSKGHNAQNGASATKKILVIDDSVVFLKAISYKLHSAGYEVMTAVDGSGAVSTVRQVRPDLILLDLNFPPDVAHGGGVGWSGLLILDWLRRMHEAQHVPVIAITAGDLQNYEEQCRDAGVLDIFLKPVDHQALLSRIRKVLKEEDPEPKSQPAASRKKILFVDDEGDWRYMSTLYLTECGYEVVATADAAGAVKEAAKLKPDIIVLDLNLGCETGPTLLNVLSAAHPNIPILIYTGMDLDHSEIADLEEQGAYACLAKGTMEELLAAVGDAISAGGPSSPSVDPDDCRNTGKDCGIQSVLIVEDDIAFGDMLRAFLESHPFAVTRVTDGAEGLRQISAADFDIIVSDMVLPNLTGEELYRAVEQIKPHLCSRFIFMTGHHADPSCDNFIRRVHGLMLWKPFHLADLLEAAETVRRKNFGNLPGKKTRKSAES